MFEVETLTWWSRGPDSVLLIADEGQHFMAVMLTSGEAPAWDMLQARLSYDEPMDRHTTFRIGGPADLFVTAESEKELLALVTLARERGMDCLLLGAGSNVLVSDQGVRGLVILNRVWGVHIIARHRGIGRVYAASGVFLSRLARQAAQWGLGGLEWAVGIPGTLGGAIVQNAGAYGSCMADVVLQARVASAQWAGSQAGHVRTLSLEELALGYRTSRFRFSGAGAPPEVILSARLELSRQPQEELQARMADHTSERRVAQPWLPSAGSVFKNPPGDHAARLIQEAGLTGTRQGDAMVAPEHANFIVNLGGARASDVKALIDQVRRTVAQKFGVELEPEIQLVGDWHGSCSWDQ
jgi:UDP-N-acetylmuramate dehydrogenase